MDKLESSIHKFIDNRTKGADIYINQGSTWMILTDKKRWIFELEKNGSLWYNYHFFESIFNFFSQNVVEKQEYITSWVEDTVINGVKDTYVMSYDIQPLVEDTIINGVKDTFLTFDNNTKRVEDVVKNGVKSTKYDFLEHEWDVEDIVKNGVKHTGPSSHLSHNVESYRNYYKIAEDTIQNGVKHTFIWGSISDSLVEDIIKNGVKKTWYEDVMDPKLVANALKNGIKIIKDTICLDSELEGKTTYIVENCKKENRQQIIVNSFED